MKQRMQSLNFKNFMTIALLLCLSFMILGTTFVVLSYRFMMQEKTETMHTNAEEAGRMVSAYSQEWSVGGLEAKAVLLWLSETTGFHIIVTDEEGYVVNCSDAVFNCPHIGQKVPSRVITIINRRNEWTGTSTLGGVYGDRDRYVVGIMLPGNYQGGSESGYIFLSGEAGKMAEVWRQLAGIFISATAVVILITFVLGYIMSRKQTKPIKEMADAVNRFGRGDFSARVKISHRDDEIEELAEAFNAMADSLERSEKSRRDLIANVSHELKTPMTTITGFTDGLLDGTIPKEKQRDYLMVISSETKRLSRLVRSMLDMSQLQNIDPKELDRKSFDILEVICQTLLSLEQKINNRNLDVDAQLPEEPIQVVGDRDAITQVVYNLIDNAAKFATEGTAIVVSLWKEEGRAFVSVENKGETISKEELPLIFDRFHKTDRSRSMDREGVGLGLYIAKTILDSHGDDIYVTSRDGVTTFVFNLKLAGDKGTFTKN